MNEIEIYKDKDNQTQIEIKFDQETVWLNQYQLAELFKGSRTNIVEHIKHIYKTGELDELATCRKFRQVQQEGKNDIYGRCISPLQGLVALVIITQGVTLCWNMAPFQG